MKRKIGAILIAMAIVVCMMQTTIGEVDTVTGTFTPTSTGVSIACNKTSPAFGEIALGGNAENVSFNVTSDGDTSCSVVMTAGFKGDTNTWTLVAGTSAPASPASNEYCVNMNPNASGYLDVYAEQTVAAELSPTGVFIPWNYTHFDLKIFVSSFTSEGTPSEQTFYANLTAAAITP